jgi:hypothetical protein
MDRTGSAETRVYLSNALATETEKRVAGAIALVVVLLFAAAAPFVRLPLAQMPAFIPSYEAALFFIDLITAALLYDEAVRQRSFALVALGAGYLFDALIIVPHALSFPGAFAPSGLLGAGPQTTAWLYVFWHGGFPLFVITYALLRKGETQYAVPSANRLRRLSLISAAMSAALAAGFTALTTGQHDLLPVVIQDGDYSLLVSKGISPAVWVLTGLAMLSLWERPQRAIDLWLILVMWIWLFDIALSAVIGSHRFDLGFYTGRVFGLIASGFLLVTLILELARLYAKSLAEAERARRQLSELTQARRQAEPAPRKEETVSSYIHRENIARYRALLKDQQLDQTRRAAIQRLLAEEEAKQPPIKSGSAKADPADSDRRPA